jgi:hypothetical protein
MILWLNDISQPLTQLRGKLLSGEIELPTGGAA